jgi:hypothetical protein
MLDIGPSSTGNRFRARRIAALNELIASVLRERDICSIIDVGGTTAFWHTWQHELPMSRIRIDCFNINPSHMQAAPVPNVTIHQGDATDLFAINDGQYDIAFSNSVIEHVGLWRSQTRMAEEVRRVARHYLIQTPYFWFPVEPHCRTLFLHWLPESLAYRLVMRKRRGYWKKAETVSDAVRAVQSARMLDERQFRSLFPDAAITREKFAGLTKSLIAIRGPAIAA